MVELIELLFEWFGEVLIQLTGGFIYERWIEPYEFRTLLLWLSIMLGTIGFVWWALK